MNEIQNIKIENLYKHDFEPEPLTDEDLCRLEEEIFRDNSDETLTEIYRELDL